MQTSPLSYDLCVVLEEDNIGRIRAYDPGEVTISKLGKHWPPLRINAVRIMYATEDEIKRLTVLRTKQEIAAFFNEVLMRGSDLNAEIWMAIINHREHNEPSSLPTESGNANDER